VADLARPQPQSATGRASPAARARVRTPATVPRSRGNLRNQKSRRAGAG